MANAASAFCCDGSASGISRRARRRLRPRRRRKPLLKNFAAEVAARLGDALADRPIEVWFQDEARIGQKNQLVYAWARKGTRPRQPQDQRYASAYLFGAVCAAQDKGAALVLPQADHNAMNLHLEEISRRVADGAHAILVLDRAGWHITAKLRVPDNITLLPLPPASPELNPVENVWQYLRQTYLSNRVFANYDAILDACCDAWNALTATPGKIRSIASRQWALPPVSS